MKRYHFSHLYNYDWIELINGKLTENKIRWYMQAVNDDAYTILSAERRCASFLPGLLMELGSYCRLWIGDYDGIIAPMDIQPEGWTYSNGEPVEPSWFWQWHPSETTQKRLLNYLDNVNIFEQDKSPLKTLVPLKMAEKHGKLQGIDAIPIMRCPDIFKRADWIFEVD